MYFDLKIRQIIKKQIFLVYDLLGTILKLLSDLGHKRFHISGHNIEKRFKKYLQLTFKMANSNCR